MILINVLDLYQGCQTWDPLNDFIRSAKKGWANEKSHVLARIFVSKGEISNVSLKTANADYVCMYV